MYELLNRGSLDAVIVHSVKMPPNPGDLIMRYLQKMGIKKTAVPWKGPYLVQKVLGSRVVRALNLETLKESYIHLSDLKIYSRPCARDYKLNSLVLHKICCELDINFDDFQESGIISQRLLERKMKIWLMLPR